jgi:hypothetical protein
MDASGPPAPGELKAPDNYGAWDRYLIGCRGIGTLPPLFVYQCVWLGQRGIPLDALAIARGLKDESDNGSE